MKTSLHAQALGLLLALGCGDLRNNDCGGLNCDKFPCVNFINAAKAVTPKCSCNPPFCCTTCGEDEECVSYCVDEEP